MNEHLKDLKLINYLDPIYFNGSAVGMIKLSVYSRVLSKMTHHVKIEFISHIVPNKVRVIRNGFVIGSRCHTRDTVATGILCRHRLIDTPTARNRTDHSGLSAFQRKEHFNWEIMQG